MFRAIKFHAGGVIETYEHRGYPNSQSNHPWVRRNRAAWLITSSQTHHCNQGELRWK
jgi:hypothetical protein